MSYGRAVVEFSGVPPGSGYAGPVKNRLLAGATALLMATTACEVASPVGPPSPEQVALKTDDVPHGLKACPGSGSIDAYLKATRKMDPDTYATLSDSWATFQKSGADAAAITAYAEDRANCSGVLGAGKGRSLSSFVIRYRDDNAAAAAYKKGILKFPTPGAGQQTPGLTVGAGTGLGRNSWVYSQAIGTRSAYIAFWQRGPFDVIVLAADVEPNDARRAVESVDSRAR